MTNHTIEVFYSTVPHLTGFFGKHCGIDDVLYLAVSGAYRKVGALIDSPTLSQVLDTLKARSKAGEERNPMIGDVLVICREDGDRTMFVISGENPWTVKTLIGSIK